jgi:hypothetical protein
MHDYGSLLFWILTNGHTCSNRDQTLEAAMQSLTPTIPGFCSFTRLTSATLLNLPPASLSTQTRHKLHCTCQALQTQDTRIVGFFAVKGSLVPSHLRRRVSCNPAHERPIGPPSADYPGPSPLTWMPRDEACTKNDWSSSLPCLVQGYSNLAYAMQAKTVRLLAFP